MNVISFIYKLIEADLVTKLLKQLDMPELNIETYIDGRIYVIFHNVFIFVIFTVVILLFSIEQKRCSFIIIYLNYYVFLK